SLKPSSWDSRHIVSLTGGKYFSRNWNIGARFRMQTGLPETPYDIARSQLVNVWNIANAPVSNYALLNSQRGNVVHQLDIRAEKKWIFSKWQMTFYVDVVNAYGSKSPSRLPVIALARGADGNGIIAETTAQHRCHIAYLFLNSNRLKKNNKKDIPSSAVSEKRRVLDLFYKRSKIPLTGRHCFINPHSFFLFQKNSLFSVFLKLKV